jgi:hypothetical protein
MKNKEIIQHGKMRYSISSLKDSSEKFGTCEICEGHATEMFLMIIGEEYRPEEFTNEDSICGHKECLLQSIDKEK